MQCGDSKLESEKQVTKRKVSNQLIRVGILFNPFQISFLNTP
jgi:hypothetical protein